MNRRLAHGCGRRPSMDGAANKVAAERTEIDE
jgi:hypothetical protein